MSNTLIERYRRWFDYEKDSHAKTLASINALPDESRQTQEFQKAVDLLGHIMAARRMWLFRLGVISDNTELFPRAFDFSSLPEQLAAVESNWANYLEQLDDEDLLRSFEYRSYEGPMFRNTIEDILTQLFGHSWYHRGQIAQLVRALGGEPAVTDFVFWTRQPLDA
jgi:uncharacterized damage-inducible protein DinB